MADWVVLAPAGGFLPSSAAPIMARLTRSSGAPPERAYAPGVIRNRQARIAAPGLVLLALVGLFIGHTLEYLRVWGAAGVVGSMTNPVHAYMLPVAGVLVALSTVFAIRLVRAWQALNTRLDRAAERVRRAWRGRAEDASGSPRCRSTPGTRLVATWLPLAAAQIGLYLLQENVEAIARSQSAPGWGAVTGVHWAVPGSSLRVAAARVPRPHLRDFVPRREVTVERAEAFLLALVRRHRAAEATRAVRAAPTLPPIDRLGRHLWRRPPPQLLAA